ncbi:hypothetical protein NA56DRAFT_127218 [Hyaloscypha hepaticicola]|uniref:Uncharacterized protein n=1 Tax=Hyaloscypha hepaticicola TaxID=2082293 RepID=A0A2J6Q5D4_9HELO|nr:hypothetical protein NA56DRAFT_127218 [Hyaloscypha hepaticicola]
MECRLAEDQHRARRRLEDRVETKLARKRGATHTFLVNPPTERNDLGFMPAGLIVDSSDNSDESTDGDDDDHSSGAQLEALNQVVDESTTCRAATMDGSDVEQQQDEDSVPVRIQDILDSPRHRRKVRTQLLARAGNALRQLGLLNGSGEWAADLGAVTESLATHPKTGTKLRRLLAQVLAELSADALGGVDKDIVTSVALRLECRYLEDLNDEEESVPICLHVIFRGLKRRT